MKPAFQNAAYHSSLLAFTGLCLGQFGTYHKLLELFAHFVPYYAVLMALSCISATSAFIKPITSFLQILRRAELENGLVVYGIHLPPPLTNTLAQERNTVLQVRARQIEQEENNVVVLGGMNMTPFSPLFQIFIHTANIHVSSPRVRPTWSAREMLSIDHYGTNTSESRSESRRDRDNEPDCCANCISSNLTYARHMHIRKKVCPNADSWLLQKKTGRKPGTLQNFIQQLLQKTSYQDGIIPQQPAFDQLMFE